jgi:hypothetical protein
VDSVDRPHTARPRLALVAIVTLTLLASGLARDRGRASLAQESPVVTPAPAGTPATPLAVLADFDQPVAERPAAIVAGTCAKPGEKVADLTPLATPEGEAQGQGVAIAAERSYTSLPLDLSSLLGAPYSVDVLLSAQSDVAIACGEIGGVPSDGGSVVIKLSEQNGSGFSGIAFLAPGDGGTTGASVFVAGNRTVAETGQVAAATPAAALEPIPEPTPTAEPVQVVDVGLTEWLIDMPEEIRAGQLTFAITNDGTQTHSFVIDTGGATVAALDTPLASGESAVLSVTLPAGTYTVYCPEGDGTHREKGMELELSVVP